MDEGVLDVGEFGLELTEVSGRLQLRVVFGNGEEVPKGTSKHVVGERLVGRAAALRTYRLLERAGAFCGERRSEK